MSVIDDHRAAAALPCEVVQIGKVFEARHVEQAVLAFRHVLDAAGRTHQVDVLKRFPLRTARDDIEQSRGFAATDASHKTDPTWIRQT